MWRSLACLSRELEERHREQPKSHPLIPRQLALGFPHPWWQKELDPGEFCSQRYRTAFSPGRYLLIDLTCSGLVLFWFSSSLKIQSLRLSKNDMWTNGYQKHHCAGFQESFPHLWKYQAISIRSLQRFLFLFQNQLLRLQEKTLQSTSFCIYSSGKSPHSVEAFNLQTWKAI